MIGGFAPWYHCPGCKRLLDFTPCSRTNIEVRAQHCPECKHEPGCHKTKAAVLEAERIKQLPETTDA